MMKLVYDVAGVKSRSRTCLLVFRLILHKRRSVLPSITIDATTRRDWHSSPQTQSTLSGTSHRSRDGVRPTGPPPGEQRRGATAARGADERAGEYLATAAPAVPP